MKKVIIMLAAVAMAACAQALGIRWGVSDVYGAGGVTPVEGAVAYAFISATTSNQIFTCDDYDRLSGAAVTSLTQVIADIEGGTFTGAGAFYKGELDGTGSYLKNALGGDYYLTDRPTVSMFTIIIDGDLESGNYLIAKTSDGSAEKTNTLSVQNRVYSYEWGSQQSNSNWVPFGGDNIPEPTSGLMLLLGMAGLALKRKAV